MREVRAKVFYDSEASALYIQLSDKRATSTLRLLQGDKSDLYWINVGFNGGGAICGMEMILNPKSELKLVLDKCLKEAEG